MICIDEMSLHPLSGCQWCLRSVMLSTSLVWPVCYGINSLQWGWPHTSHLTHHMCAQLKPYITTSYLAHNELLFNPRSRYFSLLTNIVSPCNLLLSSHQMSLDRVERAYLCWLTDADYSSPSYQSQGGVWEKFSPTTLSTSHLTQPIQNWLNNITLYST